jgi:hypothetical protein
MQQKVRNKRNGQLFEPTRILLDNISAGHKHLEIVVYREVMKQYASDEEYNAFIAGGKKEQKPTKKREALQVPKVEAEPEKIEEAPKEQEQEINDPLAALRESLKKKTRKALIKEAESANITIDPEQSDESIIDAICELYKG